RAVALNNFNARAAGPCASQQQRQIEANIAAIYVTERDLEALARLAYQEAASMAHDTGNLKAYGSIAEAALNRAMSAQTCLGRSDLDEISISIGSSTRI